MQKDKQLHEAEIYRYDEIRWERSYQTRLLVWFRKGGGAFLKNTARRRYEARRRTKSRGGRAKFPSLGPNVYVQHPFFQGFLRCEV